MEILAVIFVVLEKGDWLVLIKEGNKHEFIKEIAKGVSNFAYFIWVCINFIFPHARKLSDKFKSIISSHVGTITIEYMQ